MVAQTFLQCYVISTLSVLSHYIGADMRSLDGQDCSINYSISTIVLMQLSVVPIKHFVTTLRAAYILVSGFDSSGLSAFVTLFPHNTLQYLWAGWLSRYSGLDCLGLNPVWHKIFRPSGPALGPTQPPVQWVRGLAQV